MSGFETANGCGASVHAIRRWLQNHDNDAVPLDHGLGERVQPDRQVLVLRNIGRIAPILAKYHDLCYSNCSFVLFGVEKIQANGSSTGRPPTEPTCLLGCLVEVKREGPPRATLAVLVRRRLPTQSFRTFGRTRDAHRPQIGVTTTCSYPSHCLEATIRTKHCCLCVCLRLRAWARATTSTRCSPGHTRRGRPSLSSRLILLVGAQTAHVMKKISGCVVPQVLPAVIVDVSCKTNTELRCSHQNTVVQETSTNVAET